MGRKSVYSFGEDSPLKFYIADSLARNYNSAVAEWFKAQVRFNQRFGRKWDPIRQPIHIRWSHKQRRAWNTFAEIFNKTIEKNGPFHENDIMEDFLVQNINLAVSAAPRATGKWQRVLVWAAVGGSLYSLLKGLNSDRS